MRLIYLAGPYSHKDEHVRQERIAKYAEVVAYFMERAENICIFSPVLHNAEVATRHNLPHNFDFWAQRDFFMIKKSSSMWILTLPGWRQSYGLSQELEYARDIDREVMFVIPRSDQFHITDVEQVDP